MTRSSILHAVRCLKATTLSAVPLKFFGHDGFKLGGSDVCVGPGSSTGVSLRSSCGSSPGRLKDDV